MPDAQRIAECQQRLRDKVGVCDYEFNAKGSVNYQNTQWHQNCLAQARAEFDACMATAQ